MENEVVELYLDDIIPNRFQPREVFNDQALKELAISIREHGVIQPIIVRKFGEKYEIIAGERRYKASTMAGLTKIPAIIRNLDDKESSKVALIENLQRRDLTPIEEARTYQKILDLDEMTQEQLAKTMGKSQSAVSNKLRLLSLPDEIQEALLKEKISERHARSLLNLTDRNLQVDLLNQIINNKMTVRELDAKIKSLNGDQNTNIENNANSSNDLNIENNNMLNQSDNSSMNSTFDEKMENINVANSTEKALDMNINNLGDSNMNNDNMFGSNSIPDVNNGMNQTTNIPDTNNSFNPLANDPTTVDINKIREQSMDINQNEPVKEKSNEEINNLINPVSQNDNNFNRFVPNVEDNTIEKTEDGNEVIGNGLLAGMPVIKNVDSDKPNLSENIPNMSNNNDINNPFSSASSPIGMNNTNNDLFGSTSLNNTDNNSSDMMNGNNSLFGIPSQANDNSNIGGIDSINSNPDTTNNTNSNSLFGIPNSNETSVPNDMLFGINNQSPNSQENNNSTNNIDKAVTEIQDVINSYNNKGYKVTVEKIDLDGEVQLIVKFNKN